MNDFISNAQNRHTDDEYHDMWRISLKTKLNANSCGYIKMHSSARLYSYGRVNYYDKNNGLSQRWYKNKHPWSHGLPSTTMEPIWWGGKASYKEKPLIIAC